MISDLNDKVAVITGGASGIGLALARRCLDRDMRVAIADISSDALEHAVEELAAGDRLAALRCDVSTEEGNRNLAAQVEEIFGGANLVCLNAGMGRLRSIQETSAAEWQLQVGVNLHGPFYGTQAFLPLLEKEEEAHIVITASVMSLFTAGMMVPYYVTKAGALSLAEGLYLDLESAGSKVGVSALMPGDTRTNAVANSLTDDTDPEIAAAAAEELAHATAPEVVADGVLEAVLANKFYVLPNPGGYWDIIDARIDRIRNGKNPKADYDTV